MRIISLKITKLFGKDYELNFNNNLNVLVGLNGSGKTTILNIIHDLCQDNLKELFQYRFDYLEMQYKIGRTEKKLVIEHNLSKKCYIVKFPKEAATLRIGSERKNEIKEIYYDEKSRVLEIKYQEDGGEIFALREIIDDDFLQLMETELNSLYIPLSRKIKRTARISHRAKGYLKKPNLTNNIDESTFTCEKNLTRYITDIKYRENRIYNITQKSLLKKFFALSSVDIVQAKYEYDFKLTQEEKELLVKYDLHGPYNDLLNQYYETLPSYQQDNVMSVNEYATHLIALEQLKKFNGILKYIEGRHRITNSLNEKLNQLEESINVFYKDTNKKIILQRSDTFLESEVEFINLETGEKSSVLKLSSGEKQLFILLVSSMLRDTDDEKKGRVLLIDEPELSLHIEWQRQLLNILTNVIGDQQLIIATHSPEIVGEFEPFCLQIKGVPSK
ncbi:AAA family ATPase [Bacillus atrophaeus]|uniref:AAA family ATPase n=1 Tax=Bacillus atrophaeus TaxID=1452 RepID=UPI003D32D09C